MRFLLPFFIGLFLFTPPASAQTSSSPRYYTARVTELAQVQADETSQTASALINVVMAIQDANRQGEKVTALWSNDEATTRNFKVRQGDSLIISCYSAENEETCTIMSQARSVPLFFLLALFILVVWGISRMHGLRSLGAMAISLAIILLGIVPTINRGYSPLLVSLVGGLLIIIPSMYLAHGIRAKTHLALGSIAIMTVVIGLLALTFSWLLHLLGLGSEEALYLSPSINLQGVLLGSVILGTLGVVDDLALTQISIINELYHSNPNLSKRSLYARAMKIGQDHIASVINTLFLAYAGVSLPLLILIQQTELPFFVALQQEQIATEIMRTLVGTIGLVLVVPFATYLAASLITRSPHLFPAEEHHHH